MKTNKKKQAANTPHPGKGKGKGDLSANEMSTGESPELKEDIENDIYRTEVKTHVKKRNPLHNEGGVIGDIEDDANRGGMPDAGNVFHTPPFL